jgi:hypothetical protein
MRLRWVGDSRDYVKWDCVYQNGKDYFIFYIPMLRTKVDSSCVNLNVQSFFDSRKRLDQFGELFPGRFEVFVHEGDYSWHIADDYFRSAVTRIEELPRDRNLLVFIDPDTGIEPKSGAKDEHLRERDLQSVWRALRPKDKLIVYQHAARNSDWQDRLRRRASTILELEYSRISKPYCDSRLSGDVCFLVLEKV